MRTTSYVHSELGSKIEPSIFIVEKTGSYILSINIDSNDSHFVFEELVDIEDLVASIAEQITQLKESLSAIDEDAIYERERDMRAGL